ncbi:hypothetical protein LTR81_001926 [Elasticomyces elasticus]
MRLLHVRTLTFSDFHLPNIPPYAVRRTDGRTAPKWASAMLRRDARPRVLDTGRLRVSAHLYKSRSQV